MRRLPFAVFLLFSFSLPALPARAQEATSDPAELRPIVVIGAPFDAFETDADTTGFTEVLDAREAWRGYENVGELLERGVGVQVRHFGARDDFSTISVRGSTPNQVKILLDGVSLSRAQNDVVNLADLPMDAIERIEVYRGFTPVRFASSGAASVINIVTRKGGEAAEAGASVSYGSFDTYKATVHGAAPLGGGAASAFLTYRRSDGDFTFDDDTPDPDTNPSGETVEVERINNDYESWDLTTRWGRALGSAGRLTLTGNGYHKDEGTPGPAFDQAALARFESTRGIFSAALDTGRGTTVSADVTWLDEIVLDPKDASAGEPGLGRPPRAHNTTWAIGAGATHSRALGDFHLLEAALETAYETFDGRFSGTDEELPRRSQERARLAVALGDDVSVARLKTVVSPQLRWESVWNFFDGDALFPPVQDDDLPSGHEGSLDPRLGVRVDALPAVTFKGNIGTYFRPPNFGELFGDDGFSTANASLEAETGVNRDVGVLLRPRAPRPLHDVTLEYAYFNNDVDDMIVFIPSGNRIPRPQNVGSARVRGHELRVEAAGPHGLSLSANYTHQDAENRTPFPDVVGNEIPSLPRDEGYARLAVDRTRWSIAYEVEARSAVFLDQTNLLERSPAYATHSIELRWRPWRRAEGARTHWAGLEVAVEMDNLGDEQVSDVVGFPVPGRAFYVTLSYGARFSDDD